MRTIRIFYYRSVAPALASSHSAWGRDRRRIVSFQRLVPFCISC